MSETRQGYLDSLKCGSVAALIEELQAARNAARFGPVRFEKWIGPFYGKFAARVAELCQYGATGLGVRGYVAEHVARSMADLRGCLPGSPAGLAERVRAVTKGWANDRMRVYFRSRFGVEISYTLTVPEERRHTTRRVVRGRNNLITETVEEHSRKVVQVPWSGD